MIIFMNSEEFLLKSGLVPGKKVQEGAVGGAQNKPTEDGRGDVVEPRAQEALKVSSSQKHSEGSEA